MKKLVFLIAAIGFSIFAYGGYIPAKAVLAQYLINDAWNDSIQTGEIQKPWGWADMHPVMKLISKKHNKNLIVLSGDKGNSLAFAPGYNTHSFKPGPTKTNNTTLPEARKQRIIKPKHPKSLLQSSLALQRAYITYLAL